MLLIYKHIEADWPYYVVVKDDKTFLVWHKTGTAYADTNYALHHKRGNFKETSMAYNAKSCIAYAESGIWIEVTNILTRLWVRFVLRNQ